MNMSEISSAGIAEIPQEAISKLYPDSSFLPFQPHLLSFPLLYYEEQTTSIIREEKQGRGNQKLSTIVEIIPSSLSFENGQCRASQSERLNVKSSFPIRLHPFLLEFMTFSSLAIDDGDTNRNESSRTCDIPQSYEMNRTGRTWLPVTIGNVLLPQSSNTVDEMNWNSTFPIVNKTFSLQRMECFEIEKGGKDDGSHIVSIALQFICSTHKECDMYFNSLSMGSDHSEEDRRESFIDVIRKDLEYKYIQIGSVVLVQFPCNVFCGKSLQRDCIAIFFVESILTENSDDSSDKKEPICDETDTDNSCSSTKCFRLPPWEYVSIKLSLNIDEKETQQHNQDVTERERNVEVVPSCPGYEDLVDEIVAIANIPIESGSPSGIILTGCAGVGKTRLASCIVQKLVESTTDDRISSKVSIISAKDVILGASSSTNDLYLKSLIFPGFDEAVNNTSSHTVLVIDDIDVILNPVEEGEDAVSSSDYEKKSAINALLGVVDEIVRVRKRQQKDENRNKEFRLPFILGICCTEASSLPSNLVQVGRFEKLITMDPPTEMQRKEILVEMLDSFPILEENGNISKVHLVESWASALSPRTAGCVAGDLKRLCTDALTRATSRLSLEGRRIDFIDTEQVDTSSSVSVSWQDLKESARMCIPSQLAQLDVTVLRPVTFSEEDTSQIQQTEDPKHLFNLSWIDFGGYDDMKKTLYRTVVRPWQRRITSNLGGNSVSLLEQQISPPSGVLFHGPSGTGKSFASECLAAALGLNVVMVRASDILDQWLGGSEAAVRSLFARARAAAPCILLFDEIDAIATNRANDDGGSSDVHSRLLSTFLNEMDGVSNDDGRKLILVVATTNRKHAIDAALLRPGRLEEHVLLDKPSSDDIAAILRMNLKRVPIEEEVDLEDVAEVLEELGASGADVKGICTATCMHAIRRIEECSELVPLKVKMSDFDTSIIRWKI